MLAGWQILLSSKTNQAHQEIFEEYVDSLNKVSSELDTVDRDEANEEDSAFRSLKIDEISLLCRHNQSRNTGCWKSTWI